MDQLVMVRCGQVPILDLTPVEVIRQATYNNT